MLSTLDFETDSLPSLLLPSSLVSTSLELGAGAGAGPVCCLFFLSVGAEALTLTEQSSQPPTLNPSFLGVEITAGHLSAQFSVVLGTEPRALCKGKIYELSCVPSLLCLPVSQVNKVEPTQFLHHDTDLLCACPGGLNASLLGSCFLLLPCLVLHLPSECLLPFSYLLSV